MPERSVAMVEIRPRVDTLGLNALFMLALVASGGCAHAPKPPDTPVLLREDRIVDLPRQARCLAIDNPYGDLHLRSGMAARLAWHAVIQRIAPELPRPAMQLTNEGVDCLRLVVVMAGAAPERDQAWDTRRARVDLAIALPPGMAIEAVANAGSIDARKLDNPIRAKTMHGRISLSGAGDYRAETRSADISLTAASAQRDLRWRARSEDGTLRVFVDAGIASLHAQTCGRIRNTLAAASMHVGADGCAALTLGADDDAQVQLHSLRGDIEIYRMEP